MPRTSEPAIDPDTSAPPDSGAHPRPIRIRDAQRTRARILEAAAREFGNKGLDGARLDVIARQAGVSRELLLYHFKSKPGLYAAVLEWMLSREQPEVNVRVEDPAERLISLYRLSLLQPDRIRLQLWEGLEFCPDVDISPELRKERLRGAVEMVERNQAAGLLPADLDPRFLAVAFLALAVFPVAFPQFMRLLTGSVHTDPAFNRQYEQFLAGLGSLLKQMACRDGSEPPGADDEASAPGAG